MKLRKGILSILIISVMLIAIGISTTVKAEMVEPPMYLGIEEYRKKDSNNKEYAYSVLDKIVWKITSYDDDERSNPNKNKTLYCIKPGQGFGSRLPDGTYVGRNEVRIYNQKFDLKNRSQIEGNYLSAIPSGSVYNSLIWILEHCYVPEIDTNGDGRKQLLNSAKDYNRNVLGIEDKIYFEKLTDEDIDVVQQLAIWQFTNNNEDYQIPSNTFELYLKEKNKSEDYTSISNKFPTNDEGFKRNEAAIALYNYFVAKARENGNTEPLPTTTQNPISIDTTNSTIKLEGENYILGPYSISEITNNIEYVLEATLKNGETPVTFKILNTNKTEVELKDVVGSQFYISLPSSQYASGLKFSVTTKTNEKTLTYWSVNNAPLTDQPVVEIGKTEKNYVVSITTPNIPKEKTFDLALRKFITKINETEYDRVPKTSKEQLEKLNNGTWTVEKEHTKVPLVVKTGDRVLYTIRIYNEGEINGTASKITDYLPVGLRYIQDSQINIDNGWTVSSDGRTIVTEKLSGIIINAFDGTTLAYKDVQIECEVVAIDTGADQILKNVAEITECKDENGKAVTDRDSVPADLTEDQKQNYNPGESEKGWGYYDDDDYEDLKISAKVFDLALRKFITKINETEYDRVPKTSKEQLDTLNNGKQTVEKEHTKEPLIVKTGDRVLYTIRIYNEGEMNGKASKITDYLPVGLKFIQDSQINIDNGWTVSNDGRTVETEKLSETIINAFDGTTLDYKDVQIECEVIAIDSTEDQILKNIAEITECTDAYGNNVTDRDSVPGDLTQDQKQNYNPGESEKGWGYYDDDDYEDLKIPGKEFDLALRKFITKINETEYDRVPKTTKEQLDTLNNGKQTVEKEHTKEPLIVKTGDRVLYTIRIYNEGEMNGKASKITDYLPIGLKFIQDSQINIDNGWTVSNDGRTVETEKLSETIINAFDGTTLDYKDVQIECEVIAIDSTEDQILKNIAEITECTDAYGNNVTDRDSVPGDLTQDQKQNYNPGESEKGWGYYDDDDYEDLKMPGKQFDLSLRKFITQIDEKQLVDNNGKYIKEPVVDITNLKAGTATTATYKHQKAPVGVSENSEVIYTIRVYNEGQLDGYVTEITDYLPPELEFVNDEFNAQYGWTSNGRVVKTDITSPNTKLSSNQDTIYATRNNESEDKVLLKAFDGEKLDYIDVKIKCKVVNVEKLDTIITNIAEITAFTDSNGNTVIDRDSTGDSLTNDNSKDQDDIKEDNLPADTDLPDYKGRNTNKSILTDSEYHYKGQQDDDDFDKLILQEFDLALRKFITSVNDEKVTNRYPVFTTNKDENGNYIYVHTKEPIEVETTDLVEYTIRIYNEGNVAGYAKEVKDNIPNGLEFVPENDTNKEYRWIMLDEQGNETNDVSKAKYITTDYLSKEQEKDGENIIKGFDQETMGSPEYKDVKVVFKVIAPSTYEGIITNIAEISDDSDENGNPVIDKDSEPNNNDEKEDDIDVEHIKLSYFDLALRKFITAVNENEITNRYPQFSIDEDGNYIYTHTKEPVEVENGNIVTYTLRIYNEGTKAGYAKQVKDDLPEGLEFLPENEINKEYRWIMLDEEGNETDNLEKAVSISTDYLSKAQETEGRDNLLKPFDANSMEEPDYRDIKIAFKVTEPNTSDRILINKAQIADDEDKDGKPVIDIDSTPDKWIEGEDDQDIEKVKVKYFDLALRKWVTQAIVIENGKEKVIETGHKAEDDPEEVVKVEIEKSKIDKVVVKFRYKIRVTNEGEIPGYATEISDYIPQGLKFVAADNKNWKEVDGKIVTNALANTLLKPGESAEVEVLLTWINGASNMGLKVNTAEISKDKNDSDTPDIDSVPNNKKPGEDDIDDAPVILATKTGELINLSYITLGTISLAIIGAGVMLIKKYVL